MLEVLAVSVFGTLKNLKMRNLKKEKKIKKHLGMKKRFWIRV